MIFDIIYKKGLIFKEIVIFIESISFKSKWCKPSEYYFQASLFFTFVLKQKRSKKFKALKAKEVDTM
ncbi:hypothetical protein AVL50_12530 [Flammeovirga sp. SJP92]|nr:hypothetical protein AVL50_12530 [Flammeovirga sp. SJP92]